jgi:hypothetical protein
MGFVSSIVWRISVVVTLAALLATVIVLWLYYRDSIPIENLTKEMWGAIVAFLVIVVVLLVINIIRLATTFAIIGAIIYAILTFTAVGVSFGFLAELWDKIRDAAASKVPTDLPIP